MTCYAPGGYCDQWTCAVDGKCAWPPQPAVAWAGEFGDEYAKRSPGDPAANKALFAKALKATERVKRVLELGCGTGANLMALRDLLPGVQLRAVEINPSAAAIARASGFEVLEQSLLEHQCTGYDLAFTKGVLIHIPPEHLSQAYDRLYQGSWRYILVAEYYNPTPMEIIYRGRRGMLWKRDFAGELLARYPEDLRLVDYGFVYHGDKDPQDDLTWFLLEKN